MSHRAIVKGSLGAAVAFLLLAAVFWFGLPGVKFTAVLCGGIAGGLLCFAGLCRWSENSKVGKRCKAIFLAIISLGLVGFLAVEALLFSHGEADHSARPADALMVLGAGVNGTTPSLVLSTRIDAAYTYLTEHPETLAVLSGGQGPGEDVTEAQAMYAALTGRGLDGGRLLLEERSTSTAENFSFSKEILEAAGLDTETAVIAVVTNDFHAYRAQLIARRAGLDTFGVSAELPWAWLEANYYIREAFALVKTVLLD